MNGINDDRLEWLEYLDKSVASESRGKFYSDDKLGNQLLIEWERVDPQSTRLSDKIEESSDLLALAYSKVEVEFVKKYPDTVNTEMFLIPLKPYFENGHDNIDWRQVEETLKKNIKSFLINSDWKQYSTPKEIQYFFTTRDHETGEKFGIIQFIANAELPAWNFKVALYDGVKPVKEGHDIENMLLSAIFKLFPKTKRLFFHTRVSNEAGVIAHREIGFKPFHGALEHWVDLEYVTDQEVILQNHASNEINCR